MAHVTIDTGPTTLRMTTNIHVVYPLESPLPSGSTLYLLHEAGNNASTCQRLTTIGLYAAKYGCTVIMPEANRSYCTDMEYGRAKEKATLPSLLCCCGTGDRFIAMNRDLAAYMQGTPCDFRYVEGPGTHDWLFWEEHLQTAFDFLCEDKNEGERGDAI